MARYLDKVLPDGWSGPGAPATKVINVLTTLYVSGRTKVRGIPLPDWRRNSARNTALAGTAGSSDLGLATAAGAGMQGTTTNNTSAADAARIEVQLPENYVAAGAVTFKMRARVTAARQIAQTVGISAKEVLDSTVGAELVVAAATSVTTSYADYGFIITSTGLVAGDILALVVTATNNDTGGAGTGAIIIAKTWLEFQGT